MHTLADHLFSTGVHRLVWDGCNEHGAPVSFGIYIYRIEVGNYFATHKMVLM